MTRAWVPRWGWRDVPLAEPCDTLAVPLDVPGLGRPTAVSMGNPHAVFFAADLEAFTGARFMFLTGIECSYPTITGRNGRRTRVDVLPQRELE